MEKKESESVTIITMNLPIQEKEKTLVEEYKNQLSVQEKKAFSIAQNHLGSSFHIEKSNGYNEWLKKIK